MLWLVVPPRPLPLKVDVGWCTDRLPQNDFLREDGTSGPPLGVRRVINGRLVDVVGGEVEGAVYDACVPGALQMMNSNNGQVELEDADVAVLHMGGRVVGGPTIRKHCCGAWAQDYHQYKDAVQ